MNPKMSPKSYLPLSERPDVGGHNSCSPDDYPPYERVPLVPVRVLIGSPLTKNESIFIGHTIAWIVFGLLAVHVCIAIFR